MIDIKEIIYGVRYRVCLDEIKDNQYKGRIYYCYSKDAELFGTAMDLLATLESAMDRLNYPQQQMTEALRKELLKKSHKIMKIWW